MWYLCVDVNIMGYLMMINFIHGLGKTGVVKMLLHIVAKFVRRLNTKQGTNRLPLNEKTGRVKNSIG